MWNRKELKANGKEKFKLSYWKCVLAALIFSAIGGGGVSSISSAYGSSGAALGSSGELDNEQVLAILAIALVVALLAACIAFVVRVFALNPLLYGTRCFYLNNSRGSASLGALGNGFRNGYGRIVKTMCLHDIFLILWSLLFIVPGIIKSYSYRLVPYIIADDPNISGTDAITRSRQMMNGHKWRTFVLDLSFILWNLLTVITFGIVGIFYVGPYKLQTDAELYEAIKAQS